MTHVLTNSTPLIQSLVKFEQCESVWMNLLAWKRKMMEPPTPYTTINVIQFYNYIIIKSSINELWSIWKTYMMKTFEMQLLFILNY